MNRQLGGKPAGEASEASPLSLLVHAADAQHQRPPGGQNTQRKPEAGSVGASEQEAQARFEQGNFEEQMRQAASARAEGAFQQHHALLAQLRAGGLGGLGGFGGPDGDIYGNQNATLLAAQQQQQAAALALASDIRSAVAAAQLRQAAQFQNHDFLLARAAAMQQQMGLGGGGGGGNGLDPLQHELELQRLEELERRQLMAAAGGPGGLGALAARQQLEQLQEAQFREEHMNRQLQQGGESAESMLQRAGLRGAGAADSVPSGRGNGESSKDTFQKTPGSVVVPCRARGMPMDHNFKTAYFVIPENVEHGEELICSYFACRNAGIKFRYCTHCKVPVAKRNFRKRHKHGKSSNPNDEDDDEDEEEPETPKSNKKIIADASASNKEAAALLAQQAAQKKDEEMTAAVAAEAKKVVEASAAIKASTADDDDDDEPTLPPIAPQAARKISVEREHKWNGLLGKRPPTKDGEAVSAWLMEVLSVSDLDTPLGQAKNDSAFAAAVVVMPKATNGGGAEKAFSVATADVAPSVVIKKKRLLPKITKAEKEEAGSASPGSKKDASSFAEWKDRKKHKSLPKKGFASPSE